MKIGIIGAGASGLFAAICAARTARQLNKNVQITVYERNAVPGRKLLATGNGRCNFSNASIDGAAYHGSERLFSAVYPQFTNDDAVDFFRSVGLRSFADEAGRLYPMSRKSESVLAVLLFQCEQCGVGFRYGYDVRTVARRGQGFLLNGEEFADRLIVAAGGKASPQHGTDGSVFGILQGLGVSFTPLAPALTAIELTGFPKRLKGVRAQGQVRILTDGKCIARDRGELQFTDYGVSGIPAMTVSEAAGKNAAHAEVVLELVPEIPFRAMLNECLAFRKNFPSACVKLLLLGYLPEKLAQWLPTLADVSPEALLGDLSEGTLRGIVCKVKDLRYPVKTVKGFSFAQVTAGGVDDGAVIPETLACRKIPGLFFCGEVLDINGDCGGYNLQWAWSSGYVAGKNSVLK